MTGYLIVGAIGLLAGGGAGAVGYHFIARGLLAKHLDAVKAQVDAGANKVIAAVTPKS